MDTVRQNHTRTYLLGLAARFPELRTPERASANSQLAGLLGTLTAADRMVLAELGEKEISAARAELEAALHDVYPAGV